MRGGTASRRRLALTQLSRLSAQPLVFETPNVVDPAAGGRVTSVRWSIPRRARGRPDAAVVAVWLRPLFAIAAMRVRP